MADQAHRAAMFIGGGNMARAILSGVRDRWPGLRVVVVEPDTDRHEGLPEAAETLPEGFARLLELEGEPGTGAIVLAIKPQVFGTVAADLAPVLAREEHGRLVVSIMAGLTSRAIATQLAGVPGTPFGGRVVRTMPNTPAQVGLGMSAVARGHGATADDIGFAARLLGSCGEVIELEEDLIDAFTALAGSGPAYVFYLAEAMARAGARLGLTPGQADAAARQTLLGAATLLARSPDVSASELRARVTSKKGTTQAATDVLDGRDLLAIVEAAMTAARDRGRELAGG
ncbi:MAG: pyrroline-5-carboxylate reductase [Phycisphaerales bacterium JB040]